MSDTANVHKNFDDTQINELKDFQLLLTTGKLQQYQLTGQINALLLYYITIEKSTCVPTEEMSSLVKEILASSEEDNERAIKIFNSLLSSSKNPVFVLQCDKIKTEVLGIIDLIEQTKKEFE